MLILFSGFMYHVFHKGVEKESKKFNLKVAPHGSSREISLIKFIERCFGFFFLLYIQYVLLKVN